MATDSTPSPTSNDPANDGYEIRNEEADHDVDDEVAKAARDADKNEHVGEEILDVIEDAIPGDSDNDGH